jgi:hypothetical protein
MMTPREQLEGKIAAFIGGWLDGAYDQYGETFDIGTFAFVAEVKFHPEEEGGYGYSEIGWSCSDERNWVQAGLFRRALVLAEREAGMESDVESGEEHE